MRVCRPSDNDREDGNRSEQPAWKIHGDLNDLLWFLKANCDEQEFLRLRKEIASIMGAIDLEILVPLDREYPHLEPSGPDAIEKRST